MTYEYQAWSADGKHEVTLTGPLSPAAIVDEIGDPTGVGSEERAAPGFSYTEIARRWVGQ